MTCKCRNPNKHHSHISPRRRKIRHQRFMEKMYGDALAAIVAEEDRLWLQTLRDMDQVELGGTDEFSEADDEAEAQPLRFNPVEERRIVASFTIDGADLTAHYNPKAVKRGKRV